MQFIDLKAQYKALKSEIDANIQAVLDSAQFIGGRYVRELGESLAAYVGRKHCASAATARMPSNWLLWCTAWGRATRCSALM